MISCNSLSLTFQIIPCTPIGVTQRTGEAPQRAGEAL
jgi:hypothetical protein